MAVLRQQCDVGPGQVATVNADRRLPAAGWSYRIRSVQSVRSGCRP
jgi:hypothetical protein